MESLTPLPPKKYRRADKKINFAKLVSVVFSQNFWHFHQKCENARNHNFDTTWRKLFEKGRKEQDAEKHQFPQFKASLKKSKFHRLTKILPRLRAYLFFVFAQISWKDNYAGFSILHVGYSAKLGCLLIGRFGLKNQKQ